MTTGITVKTIHAKSVLNKSKIFDYCINPYTGCQISCRYCYARLFMKRYSGHSEPWGKFVDVKINAAEVLEKQMNYVNTIKSIYRKLGFHREIEDSYFDETRDRLVLELNKRDMKYEVFF